MQRRARRGRLRERPEVEGAAQADGPDTEYDDARVGRESAKDVKAEVGVLEDTALAAYVDGIGRKLLRGVPVAGSTTSSTSST